MIILGIDPGLAIVGWGVLEYQNTRFRSLAYGSINTPAGMETAQRLALIHRDLCAIIDKFKPTQMAVEELFFTKNITTGIRVAEARGVIIMVHLMLWVRTPPFAMEWAPTISGLSK